MRKKQGLAVLIVLVLMLTGCAKANDTAPSDITANENNTATSSTSNDNFTTEDIIEDTTQVENTISQQESPTVDSMVPEGELAGELVIDTTTRFQTVDGLGAAYTWYGERLMNAKDSEGAYDALFTDAKLTILRFKNEYEYKIKGKAPNVKAMAQNYKEARKRAGLYGEDVQVLMCCWSPPAYLKSDNSIDTGTGTLKKHDDGSYAYDEYADWWVRSLTYYKENGVNVDYVSIQNEVDFAPASYEGCLFGPTESDTKAGYDKAFIAVYDALHAAFGDQAPVLLGPETMSCEPTAMLSYSKPILESRPETLGGLAFHLYVGGEADEDSMTVKPSRYLTSFSGLEQFFPETKKWETEFFIGQGLQTAELIMSAFTNAEINAYLYWSGVWNDSTPNRFDSADLIEVNNAGLWRTSANYWAMRHYSEFIRPGYTRIAVTNSQPKAKAIAFANDDNNKIAIVLINSSDKDIYYVLKGNDYTITECKIYQSDFGEGANADTMYKEFEGVEAVIGVDRVFVVPAKTLTTIDVTGYYGDKEIPVAEIVPIVYEDDLEPVEEAVLPTTDVVMLDSDFSDASQVQSYGGFGSSIVRHVADGGADGKGCMIVKGRQDAWNGMSLSADYFENYGYLAKISYDCMMEESGRTISATSTFTVDSSTYYPDGENNRVAVFDMEGGKWYHAEGYVTLYKNMNTGSFTVYFESPDNTDDFYLDNIRLEILYSQPAGDYAPAP